MKYKRKKDIFNAPGPAVLAKTLLRIVMTNIVIDITNIVIYIKDFLPQRKFFLLKAT